MTQNIEKSGYDWPKITDAMIEAGAYALTNAGESASASLIAEEVYIAMVLAASEDEMTISRSALVKWTVAELMEHFENHWGVSTLPESEARWIVVEGIRRALQDYSAPKR